MRWFFIICLLIFIPKVAWAKSTARNACFANLKQIEGAAMQWALEMRLTDTNSYSLSDTNVTQFMSHSQLPACPAGGIYVAGRTVDDPPYCSFHGGLYADSGWKDQQKLIKDALFLALSALSVVALLFGLLVAARGNIMLRSSYLSESRVLVMKPTIMFLFAFLVSQTRFLVMEDYRWSLSLCGPMLISALIGCAMAVLSFEQAKGASRRWLYLMALLNFSLVAPVLFGFLSSVFVGLVSSAVNH
jgi:hypothetical protein